LIDGAMVTGGEDFLRRGLRGNVVGDEQS